MKLIRFALPLAAALSCCGGVIIESSGDSGAPNATEPDVADAGCPTREGACVLCDGAWACSTALPPTLTGTEDPTCPSGIEAGSPCSHLG